ncbi:MAG TPA: hypothetical protein VL053_17025 [Arachidicoccus sp.]|nr:hypothetical protein [Arachidicoccus sp.]
MYLLFTVSAVGAPGVTNVREKNFRLLLLFYYSDAGRFNEQNKLLAFLLRFTRVYVDFTQK